MSVTHKSPKQSSTDTLLQCPFCSAELPHSATFCGNCGARVPQAGHEVTSPLSAEIAENYRVTSLARKTPYTQQYIAIDTRQRNTVAINDIDISSLDDSQREQVIRATSEEYDLLRLQSIPHLMSPIDFCPSNDHIYIIARYPSSTTQNAQHTHRLLTLHDLLQTGIGLPSKQVAIGWIYRLSLALEELHKREILIGDIDPRMIIVDNPDYNASPAFMLSWLPDSLRDLFPQQSTDINTIPFYAPETLQGDIEPRSDIYSLGALLYLLLTGLTPDSPQVREQHPLPTPRELNPLIGSDLDSTVMHALSLDKSERFQSASEFSEALVLLMVDPDAHSVTTNKPRQTRHLSAIKPVSAEINVSSQAVDNENGDDQSSSQPPVEPEEVTVSIVPLQARMARRYLSKIKTSKLDLEAKRAAEAQLKEIAAEKKYSREAEVEEGLAKRKQPTRSKDDEQQDSAPQDIDDTPTVTITQEQVQAASSSTTPVETQNKTASTKAATPDVAEIPTQLMQLDAVSRQLLVQAQTKTAEEVQSSNNQVSDRSAPSATPDEAEPLDSSSNALDTSTPQETESQLSAQENASSTTATAVEAEPSAPSSVSLTAADAATLVDDQSDQPAASTGASTTTDEAPNVSESASSAPSATNQEASIPTNNATATTDAEQSAPDNSRALSGLKNRITRSLVPRSNATRALQVSTVPKPERAKDKQQSFLKRLQSFILGEPQYTTTAAALIETPMRVQPNQNYSIRINVIGRNTVKNAKAGGLSGLHEGEKVHIEVRSAIYQNYAYIVQQANITIPASGFIAEVTMPMQPLTSGPSGRRERLHIFFMDEERTALYEKPFVIEIFVSHLVQNGHEGHNVLSIPI